MDLARTLEGFFRTQAPLESGDTVLVAFSGGVDSTALLDAMCRYAGSRGVRVEAAHINHHLDAESSARAAAARNTASKLGVELMVLDERVPDQQRRSESLEMAARRVRYRELETAASDLRARYIATAHHRDDQAETVLMRLAAGRGLSALAGVPSRRNSIIRPLLGVSRLDLLAHVRRRGLVWAEDATNRDPSIPRNRLRHWILPSLAGKDSGMTADLCRLAEAAKAANSRLARSFDQWLRPHTDGSVTTVSKAALASLPPAVLPYAIVHLLRLCGRHRQPSRKALDYARVVLASNQSVGVDLGGAWRLETAGDDMVRVFQPPEPTPAFAYPLSVPGEVHVPELGVWLTISAGEAEPWMFRGERLRAGLSFSLEPREQLVVRNRRSGDRVQPLGSTSSQKLKNLLINHGIPSYQRDRLPLLCHSQRILWVPGVTIDDGARIRDGKSVWIAEIKPDE